MRSLRAEIMADLNFGQENDGGGLTGRALFNRGFHALLCYRIAHYLHGTPLSVLGFVLTRLCQIVYGIDIDPRARIAGGVLIYHGVGLVIGQGVEIEKRVILFQGVTLGIKRVLKDDGFPHIESDVVIGAGAKLFGPIRIGRRTMIGANAVVTIDIPPCSVVRVPYCLVTTRTGKETSENNPAFLPEAVGAAPLPQPADSAS